MAIDPGQAKTKEKPLCKKIVLYLEKRSPDRKIHRAYNIQKKIKQAIYALLCCRKSCAL